MKVTKWVQPEGMEVEIDIGADDVRIALAEAFVRAAPDSRSDDRPTRNKDAR